MPLLAKKASELLTELPTPTARGAHALVDLLAPEAVKAKLKELDLHHESKTKAAMNSITINGFVDELQKISAFDWSKARGALLQEIGPAAGATIGATVMGGLGKSPLSGAALGYGAGSLPEILFSRHKGPGHG